MPGLLIPGLMPGSPLGPVLPGGIWPLLPGISPPGVDGLVWVIVILGDVEYSLIVVSVVEVVSSFDLLLSPQPTSKATAAALPAIATALLDPRIIRTLSFLIGWVAVLPVPAESRRKPPVCLTAPARGIALA